MGPLLPHIIALGALLISIIFLPQHLHGWDPIQMALGLEHFDMALHQPHPPGYIIPMALAWIANLFCARSDLAMQLQSLFSTALAAEALFFLARRLMSSPMAAATATLLFVIHPLTLYYSGSGEPYPLEAAAASVLVLTGLSTRAEGKSLPFFFFLLGLFGGIRQNLTLFFAPFALFRLWQCKPSIRTIVLAIFAGLLGVLFWFVPLLTLVGGLASLKETFTSQFFSLFGRHYSLLLGAKPSQVFHNLDLLWRFTLEALSASGILALLFLTLQRPPQARPILSILAFWITPFYLWFILMFVYKAGHLLALVPAFAIASAIAIESLPRKTLRLAAFLAAIAAQGVLFIEPPIWWMRTAGGRTLPAIEYEETLTSGTLEGLLSLADGRPDSLLVVTRDGPFDFRRAMYYLPEFRVLWLMDRESTGADRKGAQVCEAISHKVTCQPGPSFWPKESWPDEAKVKLEDPVRRIAWFSDPRSNFHQALTRLFPIKVLRPGPISEIEWTEVPKGPFSFKVGPYLFEKGSPSGPLLPNKRAQ